MEEAGVQFGAGLVQLGIETGQESFVGVYSRNNPEVHPHHTHHPPSLPPSLSAVGGD